MSYGLKDFATDCRNALKADPGPAGRQKIRETLERALKDPEFIAANIDPAAKAERRLLYEDPDFGFCILAHAYPSGTGGPPHDHGPSWAIYGQASGHTEMTDWSLVEAPADGKPGKVKSTRTYVITPGNAHVYNERDLHSPRWTVDARLIRVEGTNMTKVKRDKFEAVA